jgi:drug/metabolite transporter (DMT)-like permease
MPAGAVAAAIATAVLVGVATVASRYAIQQSAPASLALLRYFIGFLCLSAFLCLGARTKFAWRDLPAICALGIGQFGILIVLLNAGLQYIGAAMATLVFATLPLQTLLLAAALGHERLGLLKTAGVGLTIAGVALALGDGLSTTQHDSGFWTGVAAVFGSAFCGALCSIYYRRYLERYPALPLGALAMFASVVFLAMPAAYEGFFAALPVFDKPGWIAVATIGLASAIGYFLWLWALSHTDASNVTMFMGLGPLTAAALGWLLLDEPVSPYFFAGLACLVAGLYLALGRQPS